MRARHPTGEQLYQELCSAAAAAGVSLKAFAAELYPAGDVEWKLEQMRIAQRPLTRTVERVRALIRGEAVSAPVHRTGSCDRVYRQLTRAQCEAMGLPPSGRAKRDQQALAQQRTHRERTEFLPETSFQAQLTRRPGQTLADRARELRLQA